MDASPQQDHGQRGLHKPAAARVRCRQAVAADVDAMAALLADGFPDRSLSYWTTALARLGNHPTPADCPKYGYVLEAEDRLVGVILLIFSALPDGDTTTIRCNVSSWYVETDYRGFAALLIASAIRKKNVTYINVSPAPHTLRTIEAQGFTRYSHGQFYAIPSLAAPGRGIGVRSVGKDEKPIDPETDLLVAHARYGCLSFVCEAAGRTYPFIFLPRRLARNRLPGAQLVYCRGADDFRRFAGPLGRSLLKHGIVCVVLDANAPLPGLAGRFYPDRSPKYFKGPALPVLGDIAYAETVLFGF